MLAYSSNRVSCDANSFRYATFDPHGGVTCWLNRDQRMLCAAEMDAANCIRAIAERNQDAHGAHMVGIKKGRRSLIGQANRGQAACHLRKPRLAKQIFCHRRTGRRLNRSTGAARRFTKVRMVACRQGLRCRQVQRSPSRQKYTSLRCCSGTQ